MDPVETFPPAPVGGRKWRKVAVWLALLGFGALAGIGVFHATTVYMDTTAFCVSCHSMAPPYAEYQRSVHFRNPSGVRAGCPDCHVPRDLGPYIVAKVVAARDLYGEIVGTIDTPRKFEAARLELAQRVWTRMKETDSRECRSCHDFDAMNVPAQSADARAQHPRAPLKGETCIDCHKALVHAMPDMGPITERARAALDATVAKIPDGAGVARPLANADYFLAPDGESRGGKVVAGIGLEITGRDGDLVGVRLRGWRQDGADGVLYAEAGKRILVASLNTDARERLAPAGDSVTIADTGQTWTPGTLDAWVPAAALTADEAALWGYAATLYSVNCAICHAAPHVNEFDANQWLGQYKSMVESTNLGKEERPLVQTWLQLHASDMAKHP